MDRFERYKSLYTFGLHYCYDNSNNNNNNLAKNVNDKTNNFKITCQNIKCSFKMLFTVWLLQTSRLRT